MEIAAGRTVDQKLYADPSNLEEWEDDPRIVFTLVPCDMTWVREVTKNGPTTRQVTGGPFAGINRAG
jgi:hypothetical protein